MSNALYNDYQYQVRVERMRLRNADDLKRIISQYQSVMGWMHAYWSQFPGYSGYVGYSGTGHFGPSHGYGGHGSSGRL